MLLLIFVDYRIVSLEDLLDVLVFVSIAYDVCEIYVGKKLEMFC